MLVGNFDVYDFCHLNAQAARRMRDLPCIGVLSDWLVETVDTLCKEGEAALTIEALTRHALQPDHRVRMEMEARTGEHKVERAKAQSALELERLLGKTPAAATANGATPQQPRVGAGTVGASRIERAAMRDPVGETVQAATTSKCAFAGRVAIVPKRFLESGVSRVECPECQTLRQITPRSGMLRFPFHDKRKTRSRHPEGRWVRQSQGWEVVGGEIHVSVTRQIRKRACAMNKGETERMPHHV